MDWPDNNIHYAPAMKSQMIVPKPVNTVAALYRQQHVDRGYPMPSDSVPRSKSPNQDTVVVTSGMLPVAHFMPFDLLFVCLYVFEKLKVQRTIIPPGTHAPPISCTRVRHIFAIRFDPPV